MSFEIEVFNDDKLSADFIDWLVDERACDIASHFNKLWEYYANRAVETNSLGSSGRKINSSGRCYVQAQEYGLPARITGLLHLANAGGLGARPVKDIQRKEVVIKK